MTSYMDAVEASPQGVILFLHVTAGSSQTVFPGSYNQWRNCLEIKVQSEAKGNKANTEVLETIARFFQLPGKNVILVSGEKMREKTVCLKAIPLNRVQEKLKEYFDG
ncbi:MAG TPA: DUF167 family protein [Candidatus Thermoplasmatota archaeon]|nr:DUF167 family protein [Candidatus Thermoplasmatota archaeon]